MREALESIWNDKTLRDPLHILIWSSEKHGHAEHVDGPLILYWRPGRMWTIAVRKPGRWVNGVYKLIRRRK